MSSISPAQQALRQAENVNGHNGHENLGCLSERHGFMPSQPPLTRLPASHHAWDDLAAQLPHLYRSLSLREALDAMPLLPATSDSLAPRYLQRAASLLGILAHAYGHVRPPSVATLPPALAQPWAEVSRRLGRPEPLLTYDDLIVYNWQLRNPALADPRRVENMRLLLPTVNNQEEQIFYLTQVEILAQTAPIVGAVVRAQEAVLRDDAAALKTELMTIIERLQHVTEVSFLKIDPNPYSRTYVDPVVWAKTVAPLAVPLKEGLQGPSGTTSPIFNLLDVFFGRTGYASILGGEAHRARQLYAPHQRAFLQAVAQVSIPEFVTRRRDAALKGLFRAAFDAYAGDNGYLAVHRLKVYGYLEIAFKVGRSLTIGGFSGLFKDKAWDEVHAELETSRQEREGGRANPWPCARVKSDATWDDSPDNGVTHIVLDVTDTGVRYQPGDRCGVLPENSPELVAKTLRALQATGDEPIRLDPAWQTALRFRQGYAETRLLPLATLLKFGKLRPVSRSIAKQLNRITASPKLRQILNARAEDQWELWDLLDVLADSGFDPRRLWKAEPWEAESVCKIVPPETMRLYSISSAMDDATGESATELHLTVAELAYETPAGPVSQANTRYGVASDFIRRAVADPAAYGHVPFHTVHPQRFHLPSDPARPIVMFAGGAGISPFRAFLQARADQVDGGENWLFYSLRTRDRFFFRPELEALVGAGRLELCLAFSREDITARFEPSPTGGAYVFEPGKRQHLDSLILDETHARRLWDLVRPMVEGGQEASFYVCGRTGFAKSVMRALKHVIRRFVAAPTAPEAEAEANRLFYHLVADGRYMQDIFTTYAGTVQAVRQHSASELVWHNDVEHGYWMAIDGRVYDVTEFVHLHPGGRKIILENAGLDATSAYRVVGHHLNLGIDAMLGMYEIGAIQRLNFRAQGGIAVGDRGLFYISLEDAFTHWVRYLYLIVEMENALRNDFSFLPAVTIGGEDPTELTPLKVQFLITAHERFLVSYLDGLLGDDIQQLWAMTVGLCDAQAHVRHMHDELEAIRASVEAQSVAASLDLVRQLHARQIDTASAHDEALLARLAALCERLQAQDAQFLREMKLAIREGVRVFETYQADTVRRGAQDLLASLRAVPPILQRYYVGLAQALEE